MDLASSHTPAVCTVLLDSLGVWSQRAAAVFGGWTCNMLFQELKSYFFDIQPQKFSRICWETCLR